ncbi:F-box and leucine-rich repeat protein 13-like [Corticium candelabrum]|uniref:F-box and leucine-rich repeat protein 13-like n=1 Tax=Corticium candelabrum TaxID=121492 RepID=UPI002E2564DB|nr:F-box and leucine-rich repeat protein 13-like [Corticium candelabrum]
MRLRLRILQRVDPLLKEYLNVHQLPGVVEALLSALIVLQPSNPEEFIVEKLETVRRGEIKDISWDTFIPRHLRPKHKVLQDQFLDLFFSSDDDDFDPRIFESCLPEHYQKAHDLYKGKLRTKCFVAWAHYYREKKRLILEEQAKLEAACSRYKEHLLCKTFDHWLMWMRDISARKELAFNKIQNVMRVRLCGHVFVAWLQTTRDSVRTRQYFKNLEKSQDTTESESSDGRTVADASDKISLLPERAQLTIFGFVSANLADLARCARVCRSWKMITQHSQLWSRINLSPIKLSVVDSVLLTLIQTYRPFIVNLNLRGCCLLTPKSLKNIGECKNLQDLNLSECPLIGDDVIREIAANCESLLYLNLSHCHITDAVLRTITKGFQNLLYLSMAYCTSFTSRGLHYLTTGKGCQKLIYLDVSGCEQISPDGMKSIARGCHKLQTLVMNDLPNLTDEGLHPVTTYCHSLYHVSLLGAVGLTDEAFKYLALHSRKLQSIRLEGNGKITDIALKMISRGCPDLSHICFIDCAKLTDQSLKALGSCKGVRVLNVADCVRLSDSGIRQVVEGSSGSKLQEVNLTNCVRISDVTLLRIAQKCHRLTYISLCFCEHITDAGVELLGTLPSLLSIDLTGCNIGDQGIASLGTSSSFLDLNIAECSQITDIGLQKFCSNCVSLERIDMTGCHNLTDSGIQNLAFCCRMLTVVQLAGCHQLTDLSLQYLSGGCHYLTDLDVSGCICMSDKGLKYLKRGCRQLKSLIMYGCRGITRAAANKMQTTCATVQYSWDTPSLSTIETYGVT